MSTPGVVITGLGAITPLGIGVDNFWHGLLTGECGIDTIKAFDPAGFSCKLAGETPNFKIKEYLPKSYRKAAKLMSRDIALAIIAANEAIENAGLVTKATDPENVNIEPARTAINIGAGVICCDIVELGPAVAKSITDGAFDIRKWGSDGIEALTPIWLLKYLPNMPACHVGIIHNMQGPSNSITCGEASAQIAIAEAAQVIARGDADLAVTGGCEAKVNPTLMLRQSLLNRSTSQNNDNPESACRPFDADAKGSVFGEAAGMMILENIDRAKQRNAKIYAEIVGTGSSNSLNPAYEQLEPDGSGIEIAIQMAIDEAGISPDDIDLIFPHGTAIPADDLAEATAIQNVLGTAAKNIVWPTKSMLSNTGAAGGALDVIAAVKAIEENKIGPAKNFDKPAKGCNLNIATRPQDISVRYVLCCSYTFGGQTAAIILKNISGEK